MPVNPMLMKKLTGLCLLALVAGAMGCAVPSRAGNSARLTRDGIKSDAGIVLESGDRLSTPESFRPPVDITLVAKTDSTNLRLAYAADQVIFNWEVNLEQLRVDGGPADGRHQDGEGRIPAGKFVTVRWLVTPRHQAIYVDGQLRFEHDGDYSQINRCVTVFPAEGSKVTVKSLEVKQTGHHRQPDLL